MAREAAAAPTADPYQALDRALDGSALTPMHWKIWWLSAMGVFLDGFDLFIIAVAMPIIVMDMAADFLATEGAAFLDTFLVIGFLLNVWLVDRWGRIKLQVLGFAGMTLGLIILAHGASVQAAGGQATLVIFTGFVLFNVLMNFGPNATTFILPAELFSTEVRASGHGFAAGAAKLGAALGIFLLPVLKARIGVPNLLYLLALVCFCGVAITMIFHVETKGRSLEELDPTS